MESNSGRSRISIEIGLIAGLLALQAGLLIHGSITHFPNVDEVAHLPAAASQSLFGRYDFYRVNPPLLRTLINATTEIDGDQFDWSIAADPQVIRPEFAVGTDWLQRRGLGIQAAFPGPRRVGIAFALLGTILVWATARVCFGAWSASLAAVYWAMSPNMLAHGQTINPDLPMVVIGLATCLAVAWYVSDPSLRRSLIAGLCFGLAVSAKTSHLVGIFGFLGLMLGLPVWFSRSKTHQGFLHLPRRLPHYGCFLLMALFVVNFNHRFDGSFTSLERFQFRSEALGGERPEGHETGNRFIGSFLGRVPVPLPRDFVLGIDYLRFEVERKYYSFLEGVWKKGSWPDYYIKSTLYKTPVPVLAAFATGLGLMIVHRQRLKSRAVIVIVCTGVHGLSTFVTVSLQGGFNHHHRYVLMIYPTIYLIASSIPALETHRVVKWLASAFAVAGACCSLSVAPHFLSYFNVAAGGSEEGWRKLAFSNVEWGQDITHLRDWIKSNPECRPLHFELAYYDQGGPLFGLPDLRVPPLPERGEISDLTFTEDRFLVVSVRRLYNRPWGRGCAYLRDEEPYDRVAYAYRIYKIPARSDSGSRVSD